MAKMRITTFPDPASAPFGAASATTVVDEETGAFGTTYADATGRWCGCAMGYIEPRSTASCSTVEGEESAEQNGSAPL